MGWAKPGILKLLPRPTVVPRPEIPATLALLPPGARLLDVGAGGRRIVPGVVAFDAFPAAGVDVVGDIHAMPFDDGSFDGVFCTGTLEHVRAPWVAVKEIYRVTRPGGLVHIDVPFLQAYHGDPCDYWRFTLDGLKLLCQDFEQLAAGVHIGPTCALTWVAREWADSCFTNKLLGNLFLSAVALATAPLRYLDYILVDRPKAYRAASAVFFRGRKPGGPPSPQQPPPQPRRPG